LPDGQGPCELDVANSHLVDFRVGGDEAEVVDENLDCLAISERDHVHDSLENSGSFLVILDG
jgi:hypothetical protein